MEYVRTVDRHRTKTGLIPHTPHPRQRVFLLLGDARESLYGGAAGSGKSDAALMAAVQYAHVPGYAALLLRKAFPDLMQPNALIPRAKSWWLGRPGVEWSEVNKRFTFACEGGGSASVTFGYVERENDVYQYQGAEYQHIGIDELTQHREWVYQYLFSRLRRPNAGPLSAVPLRMRGYTNPGGRGHEWVKRRFIDPRTRNPGAVFVPATLADNPSLDAAEYERSLAYLDPITRAQLLKGDWDAVAGGRFRREWFPRYYQRGDLITLRRPGEAPPGRTYTVWNLHRFGTCDPAASAKNTADWTVLGVWAVTPLNELVLLDADRFQLGIPDICPRLEAMYRKWRLSSLGIEGVAANDGVYQLACRTTMAVHRLLPLGQDKLVRSAMATNLAQAGRIWLPEPGLRPGMPLDEVEGELYRYTGDEKQDAHDDVVDVFSYSARALSDGMTGAGGAESVPHVLGGGR